MSLYVKLLGAPSVILDDVSLTITTRKAVALLAYLAVTGVPHTREALATLFWPELDTERARGALRFTLAQLRDALGDRWLAASREQIELIARDDVRVDVADVDARVAAVRAHGHPLGQPCAACAALLREAVALYRGSLLAGFSVPDSPAFDDWVMFETERLERAHADALLALIDGYRAAGTPAEALPYAQRWLALDPFADHANRVLIELLIANGQRSAARRHYDAHAALLRTELDVVPAAETTALIEQLAAPPRVGAAPKPSDRPAAVELHAAVSQPARALPAPATPLVGRAHEVAAIGRLLDDPSCRLLTLLGPGGSGKTRLALAVAYARQARDAAGAVWVALAGLSTADALAATIADAAGCPLASSDDPEQRLLDFMHARTVVLVLDNLEHLLAGTADADRTIGLLEHILAAAPGVQLLITSRVRLKLYQEQLYPLQGLAVPDWDGVSDADRFGAVQLFVARAQRVQPDFALSAAHAAAIARMCRLLAGQPLAIELAAASIGVLQPAEIATELLRGLDLLSTDARNVPARHRSMRASYALSWQQLGPNDQAAHQALSVFRGGFGSEAAEQIAGATLRSLRTLLDHSLLAVCTRTSSTRYELHELLRQFAAEQLAQAPEQQAAVHARHAAYYLRWIAEQMSHTTHGPTMLLWAEVENVRAAWIWAVEQHDIALLGHAINPLCSLFQRQGRTREGMALCDAVLARLDALAPDRLDGDDTTRGLLGLALSWQAAFAIAGGCLDLSRALLDRSLPLLARADTPALAFAQRTRGYLEQLGGDLQTARAWHTRALAGYCACGDQAGMATTLDALGRAAWLAGEYAVSREHYTASLAIHRTLNNRSGMVHALAELALATVFAGDKPAGLLLVEQSRRLAETLDDQAEALAARRHMAGTLLNIASYADSRLLLVECIASDDQIGNRLYAMSDRLYLAWIQLIEQQYDEVTRTAEVVLADSRALRHDRNAGFALLLLGLAELGRGAYVNARERLEESLFDAQNSHLADDPVIAHWGLCQVERALGDGRCARQHALLALELAGNGRGERAACFALSAWLSVLADDGKLALAIELETVVVRNPYVQPAGFFYEHIVQLAAGRTGQLAPQLVRAARQRGQEREILATVVEMLAAEGPTALPDRRAPDSSQSPS